MNTLSTQARTAQYEESDVLLQIIEKTPTPDMTVYSG